MQITPIRAKTVKLREKWRYENEIKLLKFYEEIPIVLINAVWGKGSELIATQLQHNIINHVMAKGL